MSILNSFARFAQARADRRNEMLLNALPREVQKDIGWRWSPSRREPVTGRLSDWNY